MKKVIIPISAVAIIMAAGLWLPTISHAQSLAEQLQSLMRQVQALQAQLHALDTQSSSSGGQGTVSPPSSNVTQPASSESGFITLDELPGNVSVSCALPSGLGVGSQGNAVYLLQTVLDKAGYYPERLITGYYGKLTASAVKRFQNENPGSSLDSLVTKIYASQCAKGGMPPILTSTPYITSLDPANVAIGQSLKIHGSYLNAGEYPLVWLSKGTPGSVGEKGLLPVSYESSKELTVTVPSILCTVQTAASGLPCPSSISTPMGDSVVYIQNAMGVSNSVHVNIGSSTSTSTPSVTVTSPNGGETWSKGTEQTIRWMDTAHFSCPDGASCSLPAGPFDIKLHYIYPCTQQTDRGCAGVYSRDYTIATGVVGQGYSRYYSWKVGRVLAGDTVDTVPDGSYTIEVCASGTNECDTSDSYFKITSSDAYVPTLSVSNNNSLPSRQVPLGAKSVSLAKLLLINTTDKEALKVGELKFNFGATGGAAFENLRLFNSDGSIIAGPISLTPIPGAPSKLNNEFIADFKGIDYNYGYNYPGLIVPKGGTVAVELRGDAVPFTVGGGNVENTQTSIYIGSTKNVVAYGEGSNSFVKVSGTPNFATFTTLRSKLTLSGTPLGSDSACGNYTGGSTTNRTRTTDDYISCIKIGADPEGQEVRPKVLALTLKGAPLIDPFLVSLIDPATGMTYDGSMPQTCTSSGGICGLLFVLNGTPVSAGQTKGVVLKIDSSNLSLRANEQNSVDVMAETWKSVSWGDGVISGATQLGLNLSGDMLVPINFGHVTYGGGGSQSQPPVISGVSGPQKLSVGETGTWTVQASDLSNGTLSYSVDWGDNVAKGCSSGSPCPLKSESSNIQQSATFTHSYTSTGTYAPTFTVTNSNGQSAKTSISVNVWNATNQSSLTITYPSAGANLTQGSTYKITWAGWDYYNGSKITSYSVFLVGGALGSTGARYLGTVNLNTQDWFSWTVPSDVVPASNYQIQFSGAGVSGNNSDSFNILSSASQKDSISITSPTSGEAWQVGTTHQISWTASGGAESGLPYIKAIYVPTGGAWNIYSFSTASPGANGSYSWAIPNNLPHGDYKIRIGLQPEGYGYYTDSAQFSVTATGAPACVSTSNIVEQPLGNPGGTGPFEKLGLDISSHPEILKYRIQWFSGNWSDWYVPGKGDEDTKKNLDGTSRRMWAYFDDHTHEYVKCNSAGLGFRMNSQDTASLQASLLIILQNFAGLLKQAIGQ